MTDKSAVQSWSREQLESAFTQRESQLAQAQKALQRYEKALNRIHNYPVHSEPVGSAYSMQDIASQALKADQH